MLGSPSRGHWRRPREGPQPSLNPGPRERAWLRVQEHAPLRAEFKKMRLQAGGIFDMSGARSPAPDTYLEGLC